MTELLETCASLPEIFVEAGGSIIEQGFAQGALFVLVSGAVIMERDGQLLVGIDRPGAIFGELSSLLGRPAVTTVRAKTDSRFLFAADGGGFLADRPDVALFVARALAHRLEILTGYLSDVKHQFSDRGGQLGMLDEVMISLAHGTVPTVRPGSERMPETEY